MLYILFMLILLFPTIAGYGALLRKILKMEREPLALSLLAGVIFITLSWSVCAFFLPLDEKVEIITILGGWSLFLYYREYRRFGTFLHRFKWEFSGLALFIIFFGSFSPSILDHFGYYVPTVRWLSEVGLVQGISNLDLLLGQTSYWHIFQAGFSHYSDCFLRVNVFVLLVYAVYILERQRYLHLVFVPFLLFFIQSPSPDLPAVVISMMVLEEVLGRTRNIKFLFILAVFVFVLKPTMLWTPLLAFLYFLFFGRRKIGHLIPGFIILILFFVKNIWTFAFPIFPIPLVDLGWSWQPNAALMQNSAEMALRKSYDMQYSYDQIRAFTTFDYVMKWLFLPGIKGKIHLLFLLSFVAFLVIAFLRRSKIVWLIFTAVFIKVSLIILFSAQYRFFFEVFFVILLVACNKVFTKKTIAVVFSTLLMVVGSIFIFPHKMQTITPSFRLTGFMSVFHKKQFLQPGNYTYHKYKTYQLGNLKFNMVSGYVFSFDTPLPAISPQFIQEDLDAGVFPQLKGKTLKEGFIWRKISAAEKQQLTMILKDFSASLPQSKK